MPYMYMFSDPGAEQHCQVGNSALARDEIVRWLTQFYPDMAAINS